MLPSGIAPLRPGDVFAGDFRVERALSVGGMGAVYVAEQLSTGRQRALKLMLPQLVSDPRLRERFEQEARISARIPSEHVVDVVAAGVDHDTGAPWLAMELLDGEDLGARIARERGLSHATTLEVARQLAHALGAAHEAGIVHRDLKPENLFVANAKRTGVPFTLKVLDFGIAKVVAEVDKGLTAAVGSPLWMAPEQAERGGAIGPETDVWAVGLIVFHALTGQLFWRAAADPGATVAGLLREIILDPMPTASERARELGAGARLPSGFDAWLAQSVNRAPKARYANARRQLEDLEALLDRGALSVANTLVGDAIQSGHSSSGTSGRTSGLTNLRKPRSHFVGRERETRECAELLRQWRAVTITGVGGGGKTRLAQNLALESLGEFSGGVWFVDLAPVDDASRVALAVAGAMGIREEPGKTALDAVCATVSQARVLFLLDNCEHVLSEAGEVASRLLDAGEGVRLLVTSREALGIDGERVYALREMELPPEGAGVETMSKSDAVALFLDRARQHGDVGEDAIPIVGEICRRLDGIPLAIELAAARVKVLGVADIAKKLNDRFRLLTGGSKTAPGRHQTLRATMEWSYEQLSPRDQTLLRRASLFAQDFSLEAAVRVCGDEAADDLAVLDGLARLVDKSLLQTRRAPRGTRYRMLETVRQFGQAVLDERGETKAARERYVDYALELTGRAQARVHGADTSEWAKLLDRERENVLAAFAFCDVIDQGAEKGVRLMARLGVYLQLAGLYDLTAELYRQALARPGASNASTERAEVCSRAGWVALHAGRYPEAVAFATQAVATCRAMGDEPALVNSLGGLGAAAVQLGDVDVARASFEEAMARARTLPDPGPLTLAQNNLAQFLWRKGDLDGALALSTEALERAHALGKYEVLMTVNLAALHVDRGAPELAKPLLASAVSRLRQGAPGALTANDLIDIAAKLAVATGDAARSARLFGAAAAQRTRIGTKLEPFVQEAQEAATARAKASLGAAFDDAFEGGRALGATEAIAEIADWLTPRRPGK